MESYTILAKYYDQLMKDFSYSTYLNFIKGYVKGEGADLACGTGKMTIALAKLGHKMMGVDISSDMLNVARDSARKAGKNIMFLQDDIKSFTPTHPLDFITCVCDGFNYIEDLSVINQLATYIKKDGYLIFDVSSEYKLKNVLGNNTFCEDTKYATYIWSNELKDNYVDMNVAFFEKESADLYRREDERHRQYIHTLSKIKCILDTDFEYNVYDGQTFSELKDDSLRYLFIAKRK